MSKLQAPFTPHPDMQASLIADLKDVLSNVPPSDHGFAAGLVQQFGTKGYLSAKQWPWVVKMIDKATEASKDVITTTEEIPGFEGIYALFQQTNGKLKYPKITLGLQVGDQMHEVQLDIAGEQALHPGAVRVKWKNLSGLLGYVTKDGVWRPRPAAKKYEPNLTALIKSLGNDPAGVAKSWGQLSGKCCFCNSKLTDPKSTDMGYGPVCAKQYGLPWGANWSQHGYAMGKALLDGTDGEPQPVIVGMDLGKAEAVVMAQMQDGKLVSIGSEEEANHLDAALDMIDAMDDDEYPFDPGPAINDDPDPDYWLEDDDLDDEDGVLAAVYGDDYAKLLPHQTLLKNGDTVQHEGKSYMNVSTKTFVFDPQHLNTLLAQGTLEEWQPAYVKEEAIEVAKEMVKNRPSRKLVAGSACATLVAELHG